jgi:hypothetical protein
MLRAAAPAKHAAATELAEIARRARVGIGKMHRHSLMRDAIDILMGGIRPAGARGAER